MKARIICAFVAVLAIIGLTALPASAQAHIRPALLGAGRVCIPPNTYSTNGSTYYTVWKTGLDKTARNCEESIRSRAKCEHQGSYKDIIGPWQYNVGDKSTANCPSGWLLFCGGFGLVPVGYNTVYSYWTWPNSDCDPVSPVQLTAFSAHKRCSVRYDWRANAPAGVTAVDLEVNTCNDTIQDRTQCRSITSGALYYTYSGETNGLEVNEGATCAAFDTAVAGAIQYPDGQTWHTYWVV